MLDKNSTALLVIDAIEADEPDNVYDPEAAASEGNTPMDIYAAAVAKTVDIAHEAGIPVIFANDNHYEGVDKELELWGPHGIAGKMRIMDCIDVHDEDFIIPKRRYSGFFQTDLDLLLRELGVKTIVAVGADTNICVLHTLVDAYYLGYESVIVEDATLTFLCGSQEYAIEHCVKCYGSKLTTTDELPELLG
ncbi:MAG: cysteine hydrolase [Atopobiaceae bacterium]|nr:cysteine hydrolase [Atopobiaceae bacterium]